MRRVRSPKVFHQGHNQATSLSLRPHVFRLLSPSAGRLVSRWSIWHGILGAMENRLHHSTPASTRRPSPQKLSSSSSNRNTSATGPNWQLKISQHHCADPSRKYIIQRELHDPYDPYNRWPTRTTYICMYATVESTRKKAHTEYADVC